MITKIVARGSIATGVAAFLVVAVGSFSASADEKPKGLQGSWRVTITGGVGTPVLPSWYQALVTFGADGGLVVCMAYRRSCEAPTFAIRLMS
jgi:hypothetical protein